MGLFDRNVENSIDRMFDLNRDGRIDPTESALEMEFLDYASREPYNKNDELDDFNDEMLELELSGLDPNELEMMSEDERIEALEDAGFDVDEFDF